MAVFFISAIDTDTGKTIVTGLIAKYLKKKGVKVTTQKLAQTGCTGISEDILKHREIMDEAPNFFDKNATTCPYVFPFPASPHLSAKLANADISIAKINLSTKILEENFEIVLLEGVGGIYVPITPDFTVLDFLVERKYPLILVTSAKLGSINHTLMSLEIAKNRGVNVKALVFNNFPQCPEEIYNDSKQIFRHYLMKFFPDAEFYEIPLYTKDIECNFDNLI